MSSSIDVRKILLVLGILCIIEGAISESINSRTVADSSSGLNQNYFFYQQFEYPRDCYEVLQGCSSLNDSDIYVIKPDGYPEPFEVYCDNDVSPGGWTVIQRRLSGFVEFNRLWQVYKNGFGFLSHEFWLGNEKLSHITNQAIYELRVDIQLIDGSSFYVTYSGFRISDEWSKYNLVTLGEYRSYGDVLNMSCPRNMIYGNCTCRGTCDDPHGTSGCHTGCSPGTEWCFCPDGFLMEGNECIPKRECPCFWSAIDQVIPNGQTKTNNDCTERSTCANNVLVIDTEYRCSPDATCDVQDGERRCYCDDGFQGDGQSCESLYRDCYDVYTNGHTEDGVYLIKPSNWPGPAFNVPCRMSTNGGGWTVFQRRTGSDRQTSFYRNWTSYTDGFGSLNGDFWLGNEKLYFLTTQKAYKLRVDIVGSSNSAIYEERSSFSVDSGTNKYRLAISGYSGNTGHSHYFDHNNGKKFSTYDQDNDDCGRHDCAEKHRGGWWYSNDWCDSTDHYNYCNRFSYNGAKTLCTDANLNGDYAGGNAENIYWFSYPHSDYCNLNFAEMKIRPII